MQKEIEIKKEQIERLSLRTLLFKEQYSGFGKNPVNYCIKTFSYNNNNFLGCIYVKGRKIGDMRYEIDDDHIFIKRMDNYTINDEYPIHGVSKVFCEYLVLHYLDKHILLESTNSKGGTPGKFGSIGFLPISSMFLPYTDLKSILKYLPVHLFDQGVSEQILEQYLEKLKTHIRSGYDQTVQNIEYVLKEKFALISSREKLRYLLCSPGKRDYEEKGEYFRIEGFMYLDPSILGNLKKLPFLPIASHTVFCVTKEIALTRLKDPDLKDRVERGDLDHNNAMDIEAKLVSREVSTKCWDLILSPTGLEIMRRNYLSAFLLCTYFNEDTLPHIISPVGLRILEEALLLWNEVIHLSPESIPFIFNEEGEAALRKGTLKISLINDNYIVYEGWPQKLEKDSNEKIGFFDNFKEPFPSSFGLKNL